MKKSIISKGKIIAEKSITKETTMSTAPYILDNMSENKLGIPLQINIIDITIAMPRI